MQLSVIVRNWAKKTAPPVEREKDRMGMKRCHQVAQEAEIKNV